ncbi:MAG: hypothetical protein EBE86_015305 [Hormoscilla sp. GUM202]|nr:hypothetical protein [Hormoscilla sp. GUM202]
MNDITALLTAVYDRLLYIQVYSPFAIFPLLFLSLDRHDLIFYDVCQGVHPSLVMSIFA